MKYRVIHETRYVYTETASLCHSVARLTPRNLPGQKLLRSQVIIDPVPSAYREHTDIFANTMCYFALQQPHEHLTVTAASEVELTRDRAVGNLAKEQSWEQARAVLLRDGAAEYLDARPFILPSPQVAPSAELAAFAAASFRPGRPILEALQSLMEQIHREFSFVPGYTTVSTPLHEVLQHRKGVCQDFAHLGIGCLRTLGLAARYVSGYLETMPPPGKAKLRGADVSHAWYAVFVPGLGWVDYDPTNNLLPANQHITIAVGRDYSDVVPVKGVIFGGGSQQLFVSVDMERLDPPPSAADSRMASG